MGFLNALQNFGKPGPARPEQHERGPVQATRSLFRSMYVGVIGTPWHAAELAKEVVATPLSVVGNVCHWSAGKCRQLFGGRVRGKIGLSDV